MPRRKIDYRKFKDGEMEAEFAEFVAYHKYITIWNALKTFAKDNIFESYLIKDRYDITGDVNKDTEYICDLLWEQHNNGDDKNFDELYNHCWERLCPCIKDNAHFLKGL